MKTNTSSESLFGRLKDALLSGGQNKFDPHIFNDPLALRTDWFPLQIQGSNFKTHSLKRVGPNRLEYQPTKGLLAFNLFIIIFSIPFILVGFLFGFNLVEVTNTSDTPPLLFGLIFMGGGGLFCFLGLSTYRKNRQTIVFDEAKRKIWRGNTTRHSTASAKAEHELASFDQVGAIQVLKEHVSAKRSFNSYEINLILKDGNRIPLVDHHEKGTIRQNAEDLGRFIGVPVWTR